MGDTCKDCRSWEEEIFWTHFHSIHFSQFLRGDYLQRLEIPEKFAKNIKKKLPETVTLKGPSGIIWDVGLTTDDDTLFFDCGWKNFVKDHFLVEDDFLIFKYNGLSHFDVLTFDGQSLCEKASSYFVRKCVHTEFDSGYQTKRKVNENPDEIVHNSSQCGLESSPEKSTNNDIDTRPSRQPIKSAATSKKMRNVGSPSRSFRARQSLGGKELSTLAGEVKVKTEFEHTTMDGDVFSPQHALGKWPVTQVEKTNVLLMAQEALTKEGFMVVMKPTHVGRRFYMAVPTAWVAKYLSKENADVILRVNKRTWRTRFYYHRSRDCGGLSGGWRNFVNDNKLEEHDVCVFVPADIERKPIVLDVNIYHVLQGAVPLSQVNPT
ncbi:B3 domain-containing protein REM16-like [Durio zibethinus]|uniref:B3 domain-containing protein REM16-like n=1 Tax=Durio zibethinus TaxID=66656 RepID=A0A6P6AVK8_DURZI|nr:B3 domain-containing protein REM16-like [Durio zibethinus]XP_022768838.1 B3 domain-containing protein REM16-like [Durio zibethinus]XP_022768839.1 B3 domain-containing protein REM16-like [Durio zibethinus]XP_022768840.1 B3 domain-containing protein REM16-like [Durio zibethinus]XP_022768841.1 B3 domain-containing protein REM16-like [Durio zibethinus]